MSQTPRARGTRFCSFSATVSERRANNLKGVQDSDLALTVFHALCLLDIWLWLSYMCNMRSTAVDVRGVAVVLSHHESQHLFREVDAVLGTQSSHFAVSVVG